MKNIFLGKTKNENSQFYFFSFNSNIYFVTLSLGAGVGGFSPHFLLNFGDWPLSNVSLDQVIVDDAIDDLTQRWEIFQQINFRQVIQVVNDAGKVNVRPGGLRK